MLDIGYQIVLGMRALRRLGIIHRELRPEKIYLKNSEKGTVAKIGDLSQSFYSRILDNIPSNYIDYFPPEYSTKIEDGNQQDC